MSCSSVIKDANYCELLNITGYSAEYSQKVRAMSCCFIIKDTNYCELLNISGHRQDTVKES